MRAQPGAMDMRRVAQRFRSTCRVSQGAGENWDMRMGLECMPGEASGGRGVGHWGCPWPTAVPPLTTRWW